MKVRAIKMGFYEALRQVGDEFRVPDDLQASWFVAIEEPQPEKSEKPEKKGKKKSDDGQKKPDGQKTPDDEQPPA